MPELEMQPHTAAPVEPKIEPNKTSFWSFNSLYIVKQLSTELHAVSQVAATGGLFYYIYDSRIYWLILATPIVWIAVRFVFEILVVPFVISYDLDKIIKKLSENDK